MAFFLSCATGLGGPYGIKSINKINTTESRLIVVPATLKLLQDQQVTKSYASSIDLSAARGEAESAQLVYYAGDRDEVGNSIEASDLSGPDGAMIVPELGVVGYVPLKKPSLKGFHRKGDYPIPSSRRRCFRSKRDRGSRFGIQSRFHGTPYRAYTKVRYRFRMPKAVRFRCRQAPRFRCRTTRNEFSENIDQLPERKCQKRALLRRRRAANLDEALGKLGLEFRFTHRVELPLSRRFRATRKESSAPTGPPSTRESSTGSSSG
jgi:hypothetical protein